DPLLLRLQRFGRSCRRGRRLRPGHPRLDRHGGGPEPVPVAPVLGGARHGADRRMITEAPPRPLPPSPAPRPLEPSRRRTVPAAVKGFVAVAIVGAAVFVAVKAAHGGFGHYYELVVDLPRAGQQLEVGSDVR